MAVKLLLAVIVLGVAIRLIAAILIQLIITIAIAAVVYVVWLIRSRRDRW